MAESSPVPSPELEEHARAVAWEIGQALRQARLAGGEQIPGNCREASDQDRQSRRLGGGRTRTAAGPNDRLTEPLEEAETDHRTGKDEESEVNVVAALVADHQSAAAGDPGQGAFDHPAVPA